LERLDLIENVEQLGIRVTGQRLTVVRRSPRDWAPRRRGTPTVTTLGMGAAEMQEIAAIIAGVLRATGPTKTASGKPSLANYTLDDPARAQVDGRARDLLGRFPLYPEIEL